jgi:hypothetical protein
MVSALSHRTMTPVPASRRGHGWSTREARGRATRYREATHPARGWFRHRGLEWALPTVFDFQELMRHAGATDQ